MLIFYIPVRQPLSRAVPQEGMLTPILFFPGIQSDSARNKMLTGVVGLVLGLIFLAVGILKHVWSKQGENRVEKQPPTPAQLGGSQVQDQAPAPGLTIRLSGSQASVGGVRGVRVVKEMEEGWKLSLTI